MGIASKDQCIYKELGATLPKENLKRWKKMFGLQKLRK